LYGGEEANATIDVKQMKINNHTLTKQVVIHSATDVKKQTTQHTDIKKSTGGTRLGICYTRKDFGVNLGCGMVWVLPTLSFYSVTT